MKKLFTVILSLLPVLVLTLAMAMESCNKSDDNGNIEKTYAEDDFIITERNIREKIIGNWEITELQEYRQISGWVKSTNADLGEMKNLSFSADGRLATTFFYDVKYRICKDTVITSVLALVTPLTNIGEETVYIQYIGGKLTIDAANEAISKDKSSRIEYCDYGKYVIKEMKKDFFYAELSETGHYVKCWIKRR